jgi:hypothetical protein
MEMTNKDAIRMMIGVDIETMDGAELLIADVIRKVIKLKRTPNDKLASCIDSELAVIYSNLRELENVIKMHNASENCTDSL